MIRITKEFKFEMAHALFGYDGLCKNIHGHSYRLWVTIKGSILKETNHNKDGMVLDFSILKNQIIGSFGVANQEIQAFIKENLPGLESKLSAHGFDVTPISCKVLSPETLAGTSLIEKALSDSGQGVLNIVI